MSPAGSLSGDGQLTYRWRGPHTEELSKMETCNGKNFCSRPRLSEQQFYDDFSIDPADFLRQTPGACGFSGYCEHWTQDGVPQSDCRCRNGFTHAAYAACEIAPGDQDYTVDGLAPLRIRWNFKEKESPIVYYEWGVGTYYGATDIVELTRVTSTEVIMGAATGAIDRTGRTAYCDVNTAYCDAESAYCDANVESACASSQEGGPLEEGKYYYATVKAVNAAGRFTYCTSDSILWDTSKPVSRPKKAIKDGANHDMTYHTGVDFVHANWEGKFYDPQSGIDYYEMVVILPDGPSFGTRVKISGIKYYGKVTGLNLEAGMKVYVNVTAVNLAGGTMLESSNGVIIDPTPPELHPGVNPATGVAGWAGPDDANLVFTPGVDIDVQAVRNTIYASWNATDPESGIVAINMGVHSDDGRTIYPFTSVGAKSSKAALSTPLHPYTTYTTTLKITNGAGLTQTVSTDGFEVDFSAPKVVVTMDSHDGLPLETHGRLIATWTSEDLESGLGDVQVEVGIGTMPGAADISNAMYNRTDWLVFPPSYTAVQTCDMDPETDGDWRIVGCSGLRCTNVAFSATTNIAGCPAGCTNPANCTGTATVILTCDLDEGTDGTADCPAGCTDIAFSAATNCTGTATAIQTCDLNATTDGTADCPAGCTNPSSPATNCTGTATALHTCDLDATTDGTADCPAGCSLADDVDPPTCTGISTAVLACDLDTGTDGTANCPAGCDSDEVFTNTTCTGNSTAVMSCDLIVDAETGYDTCPAGCDSDEVTASCTDISNATQTCDLNATTDGTADCPAGCDEVLPDCYGTSTARAEGADIIGFGRWESEWMEFKHGSAYFASVRVRNTLGLTATSWNPGLVCDIMPPYYLRARVNDGPGANDIDYQVVPQAVANWFGFIDFPAGIKVYYCSLLAGNEMVGWVDAGGEDSGAGAARFDIDLVPGEFYRTMVFAVDKMGNWANVSSDGFMYDITPPVVPECVEGATLTAACASGVYAVRYQRSTLIIEAWWEHFIDDEAKIAFYEVSFGTVPPNVSDIIDDIIGDVAPRQRIPIQPITNTSQLQAVTMAATGLAHNTTVYGTFHALNRAGLRTTVASPVITIDTTAPVINFDMSLFRSFQPNGTRLTAAWDLWDDLSGIATTGWALGSYRGGRDHIDHTDVSDAMQGTDAYDPLQHFDRIIPYDLRDPGRLKGTQGRAEVDAGIETEDGWVYHWLVTTINGAGSYSYFTSDPILIDASPPQMIYVKDATGNTSTDDKNFMSQHSPLACTWHYSDQQSGVMGYEVSVASYEDAALADCKAGIKPGGSATDVGDSCMLATGSGCGIRKNTDCVYLPLHLFEAVEKVPGKATARRNFDLADVNMTHGQHYFCVVKAFNGAGLETLASSNGFVFDSTPAVCTDVRDGLVLDTNYSNSLTTVFGSWDCHDPESGVTLLYSWQLYNVATDAVYFPYTFVGSKERATKTKLAIKNGDRVAVRVRVTNMAQAAKEYVSDSMTVDVTLPEMVEIRTRYDVEAQTIRAEWDFVDPESGVAGYGHNVQKINKPGEVIYTELSAQRTVNVSSQATATSISVGEDLVEGQMYLVSVKCKNYAGGIAYATAAVTVDSTPPVTKQSPAEHPDYPCVACTEVSASVDYVYGADNEDAEHPLAMVASWSGAFHDMQSGIAGYKASVQVRTLAGTAEDCGLPDCNVVPHEIDRLATSGVFPGSFPLDHLVCVIVTAENGAGSTATAESCAKVWDTAITPGLIFDGPTPGGDADYLPDLHVVHASWSGFNISNPADYLTCVMPL
jgi:hypothetical protein